MKIFARTLRRALLASVLCGAAALGVAAAQAQSGTPDYMDVIVGAKIPDAASTAKQNVLALNTGMFELYGDAGSLIQTSILAQHPVILGLFSGAGGRFILYRPGQPPLEAPPVPDVYQLLKSVGHSVMALGVVVGPHIGKQDDGSFQPALLGYRARLKAALDSVDKTSMPVEWPENNHQLRACSSINDSIGRREQALSSCFKRQLCWRAGALVCQRCLIAENIAFIDQVTAGQAVTFADVQAFANKQKNRLKLDIKWAADTQVKHWMGVLADWKKQLGPDWGKVYAASNTIYVARQNNVIYSVLAQFFEPEDINSRLILIKTVSFTSTPQDMLDSLTRIIADRTVGETFFGSRYLMDYALMGGDARDSITAETKARGMATHLPPKVPFGSHQWPTLITPGGWSGFAG